MKINYINGLKGICCVMVSLGHMVALLLPELYFGSNVQSHTEVTAMIHELPINMFYNLASALMCFLLLSGFVTPLKSFTANEKINVLEKWINKYFRLMPMALIGILFGWIIMKLDLVYSYKMIDLSFSENYAVNFNHFQPAGLFASDGPICEGVFRVFLINSQINSPLGTLRFIWQFSFVLLIFAKWVSNWKYRDVVYAVCIAALMASGKVYAYENYYYAAMLLGMWLCDGMFHPQRKRHLNNLPGLVAGIVFILGVGLLSIPSATPSNGIYKWVAQVSVSHTVYYIIGWALLIIGISNFKALQGVLSIRPVLWLGNISFGYYAMHWPIAISFTCIATLFMHNKMAIPYVASALLAIVISVPLIMLFAWIVEKYIYKYLYRAEQFILRKLVEK